MVTNADGGYAFDKLLAATYRVEIAGFGDEYDFGTTSWDGGRARGRERGVDQRPGGAPRLPTPAPAGLLHRRIVVPRDPHHARICADSRPRSRPRIHVPRARPGPTPRRGSRSVGACHSRHAASPRRPNTIAGDSRASRGRRCPHQPHPAPGPGGATAVRAPEHDVAAANPARARPARPQVAADAGAQDREGRTPLLLAIQTGYPESARTLLDITLRSDKPGRPSGEENGMTKADLVEQVANAIGPRVTKKECGPSRDRRGGAPRQPQCYTWGRLAHDC